MQASLDLQIDRHHVEHEAFVQPDRGRRSRLGERRAVGRTFSPTNADDEPKKTTPAGGRLAKADPRQESALPWRFLG